MDKQQLLKALNVDENANADSLKQAYEAKLAEIDSKIEQAPTDALKQKFSQIKVDLAGAYASAMVETVQAASPLSQTQMADLPQVNASYTQYGEDGAPVQLALRVGETLAGRYEIKEQIGIGGMGAVYRAFDQNRQQDIAIKVLLPHLIKSDTARERFLNEARLSSELSHPNIVNVFDVQFDGDYAFITMELLKGQNLRTYLDNLKAVRQEVTVKEATDIVSALCDALEYAHKKTVHRDIKPENIWIAEDGTIKLMDFGIARVMSASHATKTGTAMGTAYYMAPEQLKGEGNIDGRADQYALGVLLYEMLVGEVPIGRALSLLKIRKDVPEFISNAVDRMISTKPNARFENVNGLFQNSSKIESKSRPKKRNKIKFFVASLCLLFLLFGGVLFFSSGYQYEMNGIKRTIRQAEKHFYTLNKSMQSHHFSSVSGGDSDELSRSRQVFHEWFDENITNSSDLERAKNKIGISVRSGNVQFSPVRDSMINYIFYLQAEKLYVELYQEADLVHEKHVVFSKNKEFEGDSKSYEKQGVYFPIMKYIKGGTHVIGDISGDKIYSTVGDFAISETEITNKQYDSCVQQGVCLKLSGKKQDENKPVTSVSFASAYKYTQWLSKISKRNFRLPHPSEWSYVALSGTEGPYHWGEFADCDHAAYKECLFTTPPPSKVRSYPANRFGVYEMNGNVKEYTSSCNNVDDCDYVFLSGGSWLSGADKIKFNSQEIWFASSRKNLRSEDGQKSRMSKGAKDVGFRVVEQLFY